LCRRSRRVKILPVVLNIEENKLLKQLASYDRRAFLRLGAGIAAGTSMAASASASGLMADPLAAAGSRASSQSPGAEAQKTLRPFGPFLANHNADTGYRFWDIERWKREISDSRRMGARAIWYLPFQFGQRAYQDFEDMAPHWTLQRAICRAIVEAGLEVGIYQGLNDVFHETWNEHPEWQAVRGDYLLEECHVCPSVAEARKEIFRLRERLYAGLPRLDYIVTQITDYGGCGCDMCAPYPKTYMSVLEEQMAMAKRYHPEVKIVASAMSSSVADMDMVRELLGKAAWADYVYEVPRGPKPAIKSLLPETTMVDGWGKFGPCPVLPDIKRGYEYDLPHIGGVAQYSEGIHDDVNRFAVFQFAQDPQRSLEDVARAYAEGWLGLSGRDAALAGQVIAGLGTHIATTAGETLQSLACGVDNPHADERVKILLDVRSRTHGLEDNYRYWLLHYRAVCEACSVTSGPLSIEVLRKEADNAREALLRLEPEYGRFLAKQPGYFKPGHLPFNWPRTVSAMWKYENGFVKREA
jgi:hypothetical protein